MIICFTGSHSTGKSTAVNYLRGREKFECIDSVTRSTISTAERKVDGVTSLDEAQLKLADSVVKSMEAITMKNLVDPDKIYVMDRCVFDFIAYTTSFFKRGLLSEETYKTVLRKVQNLWEQIDVFFYLPVDFPLVPDGERSEDEDLRQAVDKEIQALLLWNKVRAVKLSGSKEERLNIIDSTISRVNDAR